MKKFFKSCLLLIEDKDDLAELSTLIEEAQPSMQQEKKVNHISKRLKTSRELRMDAQICDYDMDFIILDLASYFNILTRQKWESMGKVRLVWSHVQLRLSNLLKEFHVGRLP